MLGFNLVPVFPLDGGRVARALMSLGGGDIGKATDTAAALGSAFGYLLVGAGVALSLNGTPSGLWFVVVGFFLTAAAKAERGQEQVHEALAGVCVRDLMSPALASPAALSLEVAHPYFARSGYGGLPVLDFSGRVV